jgi:undecaprenyl phosphate N,N'-diacetylbacillosamine 1-phosphate transferase
VDKLNYIKVKGLIDILISFIGILILSPLIVIISVLLYLAQNKSFLFAQPRVGKSEKIFLIYKFKTMSDNRDADGNLLPDHLRLTKIGKFIRNTSLDELPQLYNVLIGDMSLVGPRPLLVEYIPLYDEVQKRRHEVKPGITGWAQVNGRNMISWTRKFEYDVWYVDHIGFLIDLKIIFRTVQKVFMTEGVSASNHVTMEKFKGN